MSELPQSDQEIIEKELFGTRPKPRARFYMHGARNEDASQRLGYPVYEDRIYVEIKMPDSTDYMSQLATNALIREHPDAYKLFERVRDWKQHALELLPGITPAQLATLHDLNLHTIEQVAAHTPETAPWLKHVDGDPFPKLAGELPPSLQDLKTTAKRFVLFGKPRARYVNGNLEEIHV